MKNRLQKEQFDKSWLRLFIQGLFLLLIGLILAFSSILNADAVVMAAREFSWLPLSGMVIFILGIQECIEAYFAKVYREFHQNLHVGVLDTVVGGLILLSVSQEPQHLALMISAFLIVRGAVRVALANELHLPQKMATSLAGGISVFLGLLIGFDVYTKGAAFLALCLNLEIAFRGWSMMAFAWWVRLRNRANSSHPG